MGDADFAATFVSKFYDSDRLPNPDGPKFQVLLNCQPHTGYESSVCWSSATFGIKSGFSLSSQPAGRLELYQANEPIETAAMKPTT